MSMTANELQERLRSLPHPKGANIKKKTRIKAMGNKLYMPFLILNFAAIMFFSKVLGYESIIYIGLDRVIFLVMLVLITLKALAEKREIVLLADRTESLFFGYASYLAGATFVIFCFMPGSSWSTYMKEIFQLFFEYFFFFVVIKRVSSGLDIRKLYYVFAFIVSIEALLGVVENLLQVNIFYAFVQMLGLPYNHESLRTVFSWGFIRDGGLRSVGTFSQPMEFSGVLTINIPFLLYFMSTAKKRIAKVLLFISLVLSVWAIDVSQTRTAIMITAVIIILFALFSTRASKLVKLLLFLCIAIAPLFYNEAISVFTSTDDDSTATRLVNYTNGFHVFSKHYLFGVGYGGFDQADNFHLDNYFLYLLIETGVIGTAMFVIAIIFPIVRYWRRYIEVKVKNFSDYYLTMSLLFIAFAMLNFTFDAMGFISFGKVFLFLFALGFNHLRAMEGNKELQ